ncbi:MAG: hypothetical protein JXB33_09410 [Clostridia bacterium]|nr:hypothetical protein [Clostridia bacterium]
MNVDKSTTQLFDEVVNCGSLEKWIQGNDGHFLDTGLSEYLEELICRCGKSKSGLIKETNIEKSYFYQILCGRRVPNRDKLLKLAIAMGLDYYETQRLLTIGDKSILYPKRKRDAALIYCIGNRYPMKKTQVFLYDFGLEVLE